MASALPTWWTALKDLIIPFVAIVVAAVGWIITAQNNKTQSDIAQRKNNADIEIAKTNALAAQKKNDADIAIAQTNAESSRTKNEADVEIAKTNAAMAFLELYDKVSADEPERRARLVAVSIPVLPDRSAFQLAVQNLDNDRGAVRSLFAQYGNRSWTLLEPYLGQGPYFKTAEFNPDVDLDPLPEKLFDFLYKNNMLGGFEQHELEGLGDTNSPDTRENALFNYFTFLRKKQDENKQEGMNDWRRKELVMQLLNDPRISPSLKASIAISAAVCFTTGDGNLRDKELLQEAIERFWTGMDVSRGEVPREDSLRGYFYRHRLHNADYKPLPGREELSKALMGRIETERDFQSLPWERISIMIYSYLAHSPRDTGNPFIAYTWPTEAAKFMDMVFAWADKPERQQLLGQELNSLTGSAVLHNLSLDRVAQRHFAESLIKFYEHNYSTSWYPAKIVQETLEEFPELRSQVHRRDYGFSL